MNRAPVYKPLFQKIRFPLGSGFFADIQILREDLNHPLLQGNKFWKLRHNVLYAQEQGIQNLLSFGGAYSNHIHALAAAGELYGLNTIGIIRGEEPESYSSTLQFARERGMQLHFISREAYRNKHTENFLQELKEQFGSFHLIPEGGSNALGFKGCMEWGTHLQGTADLFCLAAGTGATAAGIAKVNPSALVWAFSALKNGGFLKEEAEKIAGSPLPNLHIITDYHFGGYAKYNSELLHFIHEIESEYQIPLEQVYTGKALYGLLDLFKKGKVNPGLKVCFIHTGGLQGKLSQ